MKIAVFSDLHAHNFKEFDKASDRSGSYRLDTTLDCIFFMKQYCIDNGISTVLFGGDMFHVRSKVNTMVYNACYDAIKSLAEVCEIHMIPGNHDDYDNSDTPTHSLHPFKEIPNVYVYDTPAVVNLAGGQATLFALPFSKNTTRCKEWISEISIMATESNNPILLAHLGVWGATVGSHSYPLPEAYTVEDLYPEVFKYVVLGHFHKRQFLGDYPRAFYCGAPIQHSFNDEGEDKGFYIIDTSKRWDVQFVAIPNPKFVTIKMPCTKGLLETLAEQGDYVRVQVNEEELQQFLSIVPHNLMYKVELQKSYEQETRVDVKIGMSFEEIVSAYADEFYPDAKDIGLKILNEVEGE